MNAGLTAVLADTVGFVRDLPHELVAAFRATLKESRDAALLLHVIDASDEHRGERLVQVQDVLEEIGAGEVPQLRVYNKIDLIGEAPRVDRDETGRAVAVWLSASTGEGVELLRAVLEEHLGQDTVRGVVRLAADRGRLRARLFELGAVRQETPDGEGGWEIELEIPEARLQRLCQREGLDRSQAFPLVRPMPAPYNPPLS